MMCVQFISGNLKNNFLKIAFKKHRDTQNFPTADFLSNHLVLHISILGLHIWISFCNLHILTLSSNE
jgi:hypothetical protein